jgi:hypothetical protein
MKGSHIVIVPAHVVVDQLFCRGRGDLLRLPITRTRTRGVMERGRMRQAQVQGAVNGCMGNAWQRLSSRSMARPNAKANEGPSQWRGG